MKILAAMTIVACLLACPLAAQGGRRFSLSGTIVDGASNRPLAGVEITARRNGDAGPDPVVSNSQGVFVISGLPAGDYHVYATGTFGTMVYGYGGQNETAGAMPVRLGGSSGDKSIVFPIIPRGSIEGIVRDEFGEPMRTNVTVIRPMWNKGKLAPSSFGSNFTDDRGHYRFNNLPPGNYQVCGALDGKPAPLPGPVDFANQPPARVYERTCYPAPVGSGPHTFQLASGQHLQLDLAPTTATAVTVRGRVRNGPPQIVFGISLISADGTLPQRNSIVQDPAQGTFAIPSVQPGRYFLRADVNIPSAEGRESRHLMAVVPVDVGSSDVSGLEIALEPVRNLDVELKSAKGSADSKAFLTLVADDLRNFNSTVSEDGVFHLQAVPPGRYRMSLLNIPGECVQSMRLGDHEIYGVAFDFNSNSPARAVVTLTESCGSAEIRATSEGQPVPGARAVLLVNGTPKDPGDLLQEDADDEGRCTFSNLKTGKYMVWTWAASGKDAMPGPESLEGVAQQATEVEVKADPAPVEVPVLRPGGQNP